MQSSTLAPGQVLITQGAEDRTLYFVESGMLTVHFEDATGKIRLAAVGAGSVVGEGGFFSYMARSATVQAGSACKLWALTARCAFPSCPIGTRMLPWPWRWRWAPSWPNAW
jgi:CRP/FNR family cyclic AMP-dependent transcriptional regulator